MPNSLTASGLTTATQPELVTNFTTSMETIYGSDINLASNTPDGQMMYIFIQAVLDLQDLLTTIYNFFDPDQAIGVILDQRCAINGIQRQAGTYTVTNVTLVTSQSLNLYGLDQVLTTGNPVYTVADQAGNQWQLVTTQSGLAAGTNVLVFQAANPGAIFSNPNTITVPVTIVLGVTSINNPTAYTTLGINEETDAALKIRRAASVSLSSQGYLAGLLAALENINGVTSAFIYENNTGAFDNISPDMAYPNGTPSHSIWVVVAGSAPSASIAQAIYTKRNAGCGMRGETSYVITQVDGTPFLILYDVVSAEPIFIKFTATSLNGINPPNISLILSTLPTLLIPSVNQEVNINQLATLVQQIDPNTLVTNAGFSTSAGGSYTNTLAPSSNKNQFTVASVDIIILPILITPSSTSLAISQTQQFTAIGGHGTYVWSMSSSPSGGSINSSTGLYTAGTTSDVTDVVLVTDGLGNTQTANVTVT